jgi:hypothetical protein
MDHVSPSIEAQFWISILYLIGSHVIEVCLQQARQQHRLDDVVFLNSKSDDTQFRLFCGYWTLSTIGRTAKSTGDVPT